MLKIKNIILISLIMVLIVGLSTTSVLSDDEPLKVGLVLAPGGLGDDSFNDQAYEGVLMAEEDYNIEYNIMEPMETGEIEMMHRHLAEEGYDMIVANGYEHVEPIQNLADNYPDVKWTLIDDVVDKPNVLSVMYNTHTGSFMAGALAGLMTETDVIGFVGGMDTPLIKKFYTGYEEGAKYVNEEIEVLENYIGSTAEAWNDPVRGREISESQHDEGADIIYHAAGGSGTGVIRGAENEDFYAIGVNFKQDDMAPGDVLTSMLTRGEVAIHQSIGDLAANEWEGGRVMYMSLKNEGVGLTDFPYTADIIPEEIKNRLDEIEQKIIQSEIEVTDYTEEN